jgi:predicted metal-dependent phosphoesterase TrpH
MRFLKSRDCYSRPDDVYRVAKARGMDLVTITDHDSIGGCLEFLDRHPDADDFFISEEVSCCLAGTGVQVHFGVYGMTERLHAELQPLRRDAFEVAARLRDARVFFTLNHLLHFYRGQLPLSSYLRLLDVVPGVEARNGTMIAEHNGLVERLAAEWRPSAPLAMVGGSDAHTLRRIGRTWTEAPAADVGSFLVSLREGSSRAAGAHGGTACVAGDAYGVVARYAASLVGFGPRDHSPLRRVGCLAFSVVSLPAQILPLAIVASGKRREREIVRYVRAEIEREAVVATAVAEI